VGNTAMCFLKSVALVIAEKCAFETSLFFAGFVSNHLARHDDGKVAVSSRNLAQNRCCKMQQIATDVAHATMAFAKVRRDVFNPNRSATFYKAGFVRSPPYSPSKHTLFDPNACSYSFHSTLARLTTSRRANLQPLRARSYISLEAVPANVSSNHRFA